jgi:ankyrin repeat protein
MLHKMNDDRRAKRKLINAINKNDTAAASSLISSGSVNLNVEPWPLHLAAQHGRVEIMTMLLDAGADINAVEEKILCTACHVAIFRNQFDALKLLVERGANLGVVDSNGPLLAIVARYEREERFVLLLLDAGAPLDGLTNGDLMALVKSVAVFNRLLARGVNLTAMRDDDGATLCHYVARNITREDDARSLVNVCGNDAIHAVDDNGKTPLPYALKYSNDSAVRVLVELGAEIDQQDNDGWTALISAAEESEPSFVELLLALGADVDVVANNGETACHRASWLERPASLCALVAAGGDLDQLDSDGETPRTIAIHERVALPTADEINAAHRRIAKTRLDLVRERAFQICVGLQSFRLNALQLCEILMHSFGAIGSVILFHQWWAIATTVKHFRDHKQQSSATTTTSATNNETKTQ